MASTLAYTSATPARKNNRDQAARMAAAARRAREREAAALRAHRAECACGRPSANCGE